MTGQLGDMVFDLLKEPIGIQGNKKWTYAKHPVTWAQTKLQYTGYEPREYKFGIRYHASFCVPEEEIEALEALADNRGENGFREPLPFIVGDGEVLGEFVITQIDRGYVRQFPTGEILELNATVHLTEFL